MISSPQPKHSLTQSKDGTEIDPSLLQTVLRGPIFGLYHACQQSRKLIVAANIYKDIEMGGLFDQERDVVLWLPEKLRKTPEGWSGNYEPALDSFLSGGGIPLQALENINHVARPIHEAEISAKTGRLLRYETFQTFPHAERFTVLARGPVGYAFERGWKKQRHNRHVYPKPPPKLVFVDYASLELVDP